MKNYTDLVQSRKLAKILPTESADMRIGNHVGKNACVDGTNVRYYHKSESFSAPEIVNAWSLASLLSVLPNEIITDNRFECHYQIDLRKYDGGDNTTLYQIAYGNSRGLSGSWHDMINTGEKENLIDACVDMIENLHRLKMLGS